MDSVFLFVAIVAIVILAAFIIAKLLFSKHPVHCPRIPGPRGLPFVGSALSLDARKPHEQFTAFARQYGSIFKIRLFNADIVVLNSVEMMNRAFVRDNHIFNDREDCFIVDHIGILKSVSFNDLNKEHQVAKRAFLKSLHMYGSGIANFEVIVQHELERVIREIESYGGKEFEAVGLIERSIVNIISILLIGEEALDEHVKLFFQYTSQANFFLDPAINSLVSSLPFVLHLPFFDRKIKEVIEAKRVLQEKYVMDVKAGRVDKDKVGLVNALLQCQGQNAGEEITITDEMLHAVTISDVLTAGILTTSSTLPNILICLINHPEYQARIQDEIDRVVGPDRKPSIKDKQDCHFIQAVILETMRYIPSMPFLLPHACKKTTVFEGYHIQANTTVLANVWFILHDESIWNDPWTFRPERFLDEDGKFLPNDHHYMKSFVGFGLGRRKCPGMGMATTRMFLYLATLFQKYTIIPCPGKVRSCDPRSEDFQIDLLVKPKPFYCICQKREDVT